MGFLDQILGASSCYGIAQPFPQQQQLAAMQQQRFFGEPSWQEKVRYEQLLGMQPSVVAMPGCMLGMSKVVPRVKHVESRELSPREVARKQINGAVQDVKDAQDRAR